MAPERKVINGYYRYTDIWFDWPKACLEDEAVLKGILAHDSLVSPEHPLHVDGVEGAQLYLGTFKSGEIRLLFSSKQVEYVRYWLHAFGYTKTPVPMPYSDCLLRESDLRGVATQNYKTGGDLKKALSKIDKNNKRLRKGGNPRLTSLRSTFDNVQTLYKTHADVWCSVDFESWEMEHTVLTEFGWSVIRWDNAKEIREDGHLIVSEHRTYTNGKYVANHRDNFNFGESEVVSKAVFKTRIQTLIAGWRQLGNVFLVFHDAGQDIKYLKSAMVEADLSDLSWVLPAPASSVHGLFVVDTADLFAALEGSDTRRGLEQMCRHLQIPTQFLHNAGNDAHYTLSACKAMAGGDTLDVQRESRWPNRTGAGGMKVDFKPWEENSDYSDEEGLL